MKRQIEVARFNKHAVQQVIGREAETATLFGTSSVTFYVVAGGFRPRQLRRSTFRVRATIAIDEDRIFQRARL